MYFSVFTIVTFVAFVFAEPSPYLDNYRYPLKAIAILSNDSHNVTGTVRFVQDHHHGPTDVYATVSGLEPGTKHGIHVHQFGDLSKGCTSLGEHYNPLSQDHGGPDSVIRHVGDFGNIESNDGEEATLRFTIPTLQLEGATSVLGRSVVLHFGEDDLGLGDTTASKENGNSGARLACGIIGVTTA